MYEWMVHYGFQPVIIATKLDKIKRSQVEKQVKAIRTGLQAGKDAVIIPWSSMTKQGKEEIYALMDQYLERSSL